MSVFLYLSIFLAVLSNAMMALALPWLVLQETGSVMVTGTIGALALSAVFAGSLLTRKMIAWLGADGLILISYIANIVGILGLLFCFSQPELNIPFLLVFILIDRFFDSAAVIAVDNSLPEFSRLYKIPLSKINGIKEALLNGAAILGAGSAGWMLSIFDPAYVLWGAAVISLLGLICFIPLFNFYRRRKNQQNTTTIFASLKWIWGQPDLRAFLILIIVVMSSIASLDDVLLPAFINSTTQDPADIGWIMVAYGVTAIISAFIYAHCKTTAYDHTLTRIGIIGVAIFFISLVLFDDPFYIIVMTAICGAMSGALFPIIETRFLSDTPKSMRLGMLAALTTVSVAIAPVMVFAHGWIIDMFSVQALSLGTALLILGMLLLKTRKKNAVI